MYFFRSCCNSLALILSVFWAGASIANELDIHIVDEQGGAGKVLLEIYYSASPFLEEQGGWDELTSHTKQDTDLSEGVAKVSLKDLASGWYAVRLFLDENNNGKLDSSRIGLPLEAVGFSTNPALFRGEPDIDDVSFEVDENIGIEIELVRNKKKSNR